MIKNREPNDDWCKVERMIPAMTRGRVSRCSQCRMVLKIGWLNRGCSRMVGENSSTSTEKYNITHQAISNMTEWCCQCRIGM